MAMIGTSGLELNPSLSRREKPTISTSQPIFLRALANKNGRTAPPHRPAPWEDKSLTIMETFILINYLLQSICDFDKIY